MGFNGVMKQFFTKATQRDDDDYSSLSSLGSYDSYSMTDEAYERYKQLEALANLCREMGFDSIEDTKRFLEGRKVERKKKKIPQEAKKRDLII